MKLVGALTLLPLLCLATHSKIESRFNDYFPQLQSSAPLKLDDGIYEKLIAVPRNYSVVVLLTALEARFGCQLCKDFQPEWDLLARSWVKGDRRGESRTLFGTMDFTDGKGTFQKVSQSRSYHYDEACYKYFLLAPIANSSRRAPIPSNKRTKCEA